MNEAFTTGKEKVGRAVLSAPGAMWFVGGGLRTARPTIFTVEGARSAVEGEVQGLMREIQRVR